MNVALFYDDDAYREPPPGARRAGRVAPGGAMGLMGRQVAGKSFLDAYLSHGNWSELTAVVRSREAWNSLVRFCETHPSSAARRRRLKMVLESRFLSEFVAAPPAPIFHVPNPLEARHAWARVQGPPDGFALSGVTHTLCSAAAVGQLTSLLTAPFEPYDVLFCTSKAVVQMVRAVTDAYADFLRERHGGTPRVPVRLELVPLGVDPDRFRPATPAERSEARRKLGIIEDEIVILFVGRLSHHAKAHPFPLFRGAAEAAQRTGKPLRLLLGGWTANEAIHRAFADGATRFAPGVRVSMVDASRPEFREVVWRAADIFASPSDNIQETFGLVIIEAMACGLPVVATDWDGYRDMILPGQTGILVPTLMVQDATADTTGRLLAGELNYDHFLAHCNQTVTVDLATMAQALARLVEDAPLRRRMGAAGRKIALERFAWRHVIAAYERIWASQEAELRERSREATPRSSYAQGPACYPAPERAFAGYPTRFLGDDDRLVAAPRAEAELVELASMPLTNYAAEHRVTDLAILRSLLTAAAEPRRIADLDAILAETRAPRLIARATIAWMLKYGLLLPTP